jgi:hypothetical protein
VRSRSHPVGLAVSHPNGEGVYFVKSAAAAHPYCTPSVAATPKAVAARRMILARVSLGVVAVNTDPKKKAADLKVSAADPATAAGSSVSVATMVDRLPNPQVFVLTRDAQAYPQFVITYTD